MIVLVLVVAVVRAASTRLDLAALLAIALAGAATAGAVLAEGVLAWPALTLELSAARLANSLDPAVAQALVLSRDGLHAPVAVVLGLAILLLAWLLVRSDLWGHKATAVLTAGFGVFAAAYMLLGPESLGPNLIAPWGVVMAVVLVVDLRRRPGMPPTT